MYEGEVEFLSALDRLSKGQVPLENFKNADEYGDEIYVFLENNKYILYLTKDCDLKVKEKSTGEIGEALGLYGYNKNTAKIKYSYGTKLNPKMVNIIDGQIWMDNLYKSEYYFSEYRIISADERVTILYIYLSYPGYNNDCLYLTNEAFDSLKVNVDIWEKDILWFNTAEHSLRVPGYEYMGDIIEKDFYHYFPMSQNPQIGRKKILIENDIGFNEIRQIYDDLGLTEYYNENAFGHIIPVTYRLTEKGLEQSIDKSNVLITNLLEGVEVDFTFTYEDESKKPDFIGDLVVK